MSSAGTATIFGAYGHTGRFVVAELRRRGWTLVVAGRNAGKLHELAAQHGDIEARVASVDLPETLDRALAGSALVVNCAGPFLDTADPILEAALRSGSHYLDVTAEQSSAAATHERFDEPFRKAALVAVPAMGFFGGLADLLATAAMQGQETADEIRIGIGLDSWRPTQGTRITGQRNKARRLTVAHGVLAPLPDPAPTHSWQFPEPFGTQEVVELPFSEVILIARHLRVSALHTYLNLAPLKDLRNPETPAPTAADETGRSAQTFIVDVLAKMGAQTRRVTAQGRDIYAVTAPLVAEAAERILEGGVRNGGVYAPGEIFDAPTFLRALTPGHLLFQI